MAGLILSTAGAAIGGAIGGSFLGISSVVIGQSIGAVIGNAIDTALFAPTMRSEQEGPRLEEANVMTSVEGAPVYRGYGRFKVSGNIIWSTRLREEVVKTTESQGGKGGGGGKTQVTTTTYDYYANFAVALCEGEISEVHRIWADGSLLDLSAYTYRVYRGTETQMPDSLMEQKDGEGNVPGYRGLAYVVFEDMPINKFGKRIPQMSFEVTRRVTRSDEDAVNDLVTSVCLVPGTLEFGYDPEKVTQQYDDGESRIENDHLGDGESDWKHALDQMETNLPNVNTVCFVVSWFGDDLRMGNCELKPRVENDTKNTEPYSWEVAELNRTTATVVSRYAGDPAYGGTPNDTSVYRAIADLKTRGYEVLFYPFLLMDIEEGNSLPDPYSDNALVTGQPPYPWRGRITCSPSRGFLGSVDQTATAGTQVSQFLGNADASDFSGSEGDVSYSGPTDWGFRRFILHYAELCRQAGGVDYFCIGTEMVEANRVRSNASTFPFVDGLVDLAGEVRSLLPGAELGYAADWSEYNSYRPDDGSDDVYFHLDPLWADSDIDFIGINNYMKLSDWRDNDSHLDYGDGTDDYGNPKGASVYDLEYLKGQIEGGEDYDYFYATVDDRVAQDRTDIEDSTYGKPWVFRQKDIKNWWQNSHYNRPGGVESITATAWVPESKPVLFTEFGCPAINKGTNQPNVSYDPKSSESQVPYFSSGGRDDDIQRQYIRAMMEYWTDNANNPSSSEYAGRMLDTDRMCCWAYDARPWPTFPVDGDTWADQPNWQFGPWISGRIDTVYIPDLLSQLAEDYDFQDSYDFSRAYGSCDGFVIQNKTSFRSAVEPLATLFAFDIIESGSGIKAVSQQENQSMATVTLRDLSETESDQEEPVVFVRSQQTELPTGVSIRYIDIFDRYERAAVSQKREVFNQGSEPITDTPVVMDFTRAQQLADRMLYTAWAGKTTADFGLLPEFLYLEAGDVVTIDDGYFNRSLRIQNIADSGHRKITARSFNSSIFQPGGGASRTQQVTVKYESGTPLFLIMDLPILDSTNFGPGPYVAAHATPWGGVNVHRSVTDSNYTLIDTLAAPSPIGVTTDTFSFGKPNVWDDQSELKIRLFRGSVASLPEINVLEGFNSIAVETAPGVWEVVQFVTATLTGDSSYTLTRLLRGQRGTEDNIANALSAGARVAVLDSTVGQLTYSTENIDREYHLRWGPAGEDIGSPRYEQQLYTAPGRPLKPFAPCHFKVSINDNTLTLSWTRRTRYSGDSWDATEIPLNEDIERYRVRTFDVGDPVWGREYIVENATTLTINLDDDLDYPFDLEIVQLSDIVGAGIPRRVTITGEIL